MVNAPALSRGNLARQAHSDARRISRSCLKRYAAPLLFVVMAVTTADALADTSFAPRGGSAVPRIFITGEIKPADLRDFLTFARLAKQKEFPIPYQVVLDSLGGDVETALQIGRAMRLDKASVVVLDNAECLSSCVFLLAGGVIRLVDGRVGIHRPFAISDRRTTADQQKRYYGSIEKDLKSYLAAVNISTALYDQMFRVPPGKIRYLDGRELQEFGLSEDDPYEDAARIASMAQSLGITSSELIRREAKAKVECTALRDADATAKCFGRILKEGR